MPRRFLLLIPSAARATLGKGQCPFPLGPSVWAVWPPLVNRNPTEIIGFPGLSRPESPAMICPEKRQGR